VITTLNEAGKLVPENNAPLRKNHGKITKLEIKPKPSGQFIIEPIINPRLVIVISKIISIIRGIVL
jgi:hypothetical protein